MSDRPVLHTQPRAVTRRLPDATWGILTAMGDPGLEAASLGLLSEHLEGVISLSTVAPGGAGGGGALARLQTGLIDVPRDVDRVAYVDARALASLGIEPVLAMIPWLDEHHAAVVRAVQVTDALKRTEDGRIVETVDRTGLYAPRPPHIFRRDTLETVLAQRGAHGEDVIDPTSLIFAAGHRVRVLREAASPMTISLPDVVASEVG